MIHAFAKDGCVHFCVFYALSSYTSNLHNIHCLLYHITIVETMDRYERGMNQSLERILSEPTLPTDLHRLSSQNTKVVNGSVVKCLTRNPVVLGSSRTGTFGVSLGKTLRSPCLVLVKSRKYMNNVTCHHDMTGILLTAA